MLISEPVKTYEHITVATFLSRTRFYYNPVWCERGITLVKTQSNTIRLRLNTIEFKRNGKKHNRTT